MRGFVAFERAEQQYSAFQGKSSTEWVTVECPTLTLLLDTPGGRVGLTNGDYILLHARLQRTKPGGSRLMAFTVGEPVVMIKSAAGDGRTALSAKWLVGGTRQAYLEALSASDGPLL